MVGSVAPVVSPAPSKQPPAPIWVSNSIFFAVIHIMGFVGAFHPRMSPWWELDRRTLWMAFISWQLASFGITIGYHRLWSHRSFTASFPLRVVLAGMGCLGFQGSIKWWVLRHRLHHRFTDSESDPYNAKQGLYYSHMGWIFRKPMYPRMALIERNDLEADSVVRFQHKYYLPLTLGLGLVLPTLIGWSYGDALGGFVWGGVAARLMIWHCTFCINSFAHYLGDQEYSRDVTARGNFLLAIVTGGEANHNYHHAFPKDYRNGPRSTDFDPTKWLIYLLHHLTPFVSRVHQTPASDILKARAHVLHLQSTAIEDSSDDPDVAHSSSLSRWSAYASATSSEADSTGYGSSESSSSTASWRSESEYGESLLEGSRRKGTRGNGGGLPRWTKAELVAHVGAEGEGVRRTPIVLLLDGYAVDVTAYAREHPGGYALLVKYAVKGKAGGELVDATEAFSGGLNEHGWSARKKMRGMRVARII